MKNRKHFSSWLVIALLCLAGWGIYLFPAVRFSAYITFGISFVVLCYQLLRLASSKRPLLCRILRRMLTVCLCLGILIASITGGFVIHAASGSADASCDYLIVLGAGLRGTVPSLTLQERLDEAYNYLTAHPDTVCIVSGGQGPGEDMTEAECMYRYLTQKGIPGERILKEDKATSTYENLFFSREMIPNFQSAATGILSSEYHLFRAGLMAQELALNPIFVPARTQWISLRINYYLREIVGVWHYFILGG